MKIIENLIVEYFVKYKCKRIYTYSNIYTHTVLLNTHNHIYLEYKRTLKWVLFLYVLQIINDIFISL